MIDAALFQYGSQFRRKQMEGIMADSARAYEMVMSIGARLENNENAIRDKLAQYLEDDDYKENCTSMVRNFQVDHEVSEGLHGRVDFRFHQVNPYEGQKVYFIVECKRLDGESHLNTEYVVNGINRFKCPGKYSTQLGVNAMMGFLVKKLDVPATCGNINSHLTAEEKLVMINTEFPAGCYGFVSDHSSSTGMFTLLHLWMDFTPCV